MAVTADEIRVIIRSEFDNALRDYKKLNRGLDDTNSKLAHSAAVAKKYGRSLTRYLTLPIAAAAAASVKFAADIEQQRVKFETLIGDVEEGAKHFERLKEFSAKTPLQLEDIADASLTLQGFGTDADDVIETLTMLGNAAQGQSSKLDRLVLAFGKLQAKGRATLEELNMFTEAGVPLMQQLAEQFDVSTEELFRMVSQGEVTFTDVRQALVSLTTEGGKFDGLLEKMSQTTAGKFSTALDNLKLTAADFGEVLLPIANDLLENVTDLLQKFNELDDSTKKLILAGAGLAAFAGPIMRAAGGSITLLSKMKAITRLGPALKAGMVGPWLAVVGVIAAATFAAAKYDQQRRKNIENAGADVENFYNIPANAVQALEGEVRMLFDTWRTGFGEISDTPIEDIIDRIETKFAEAGTDIEITREQVIQMLADLPKMTEDAFAQIAKDFSLSKDDLANVESPHAFIQAYIDSISDDLDSYLAGNTDSVKKTWQEWWADVTGAEGDVSGRLGGDLAAEYLAGFERELNANRDVSIALGEYFDPTEIYEQKISELRETLIGLLSIDPNEIENPANYFKLQDDSVKELLGQINEYETALERMRISEERSNEIHEEYALNLMGISAAALEAEYRITGFAESVEEAAPKIESAADIAKSLFENFFPPIEDSENVWGYIADNADELVNSLFDVGEIMGRIGRGSDDAKDQLRDMLIDAGKSATAWALAAGLRTIASGNLPLGIALLALAGVTGIATAVGISNRSDEEADTAIQTNEELRDVIQEEIDIRREALRQLEDEFNREYDIIRDQWQRGLITTEEFRNQAEELGSTYASDREAYNEEIRNIRDAESIADVDAAPHGADFITNGPRLLMVGDNPGGRERVSVEPISSRNMYGPSGGNSIIIQGNTFVGVGGVDQLIEMIESRKKTLQRTGRV